MKLGIVATTRRTLLPGNQYNKLIPAPSGQNVAISPNASPEETVRLMVEITEKYYRDAEQVAPLLLADSLMETCRNIWDFIYQHIQYVRDDGEQLRRFARTWADRKGDCDCYAIAAGSILKCLGIPFRFRITKYNGYNFYQHVYVVVDIPKNN
jgi:hypothetical protein